MSKKDDSTIHQRCSECTLKKVSGCPACPGSRGVNELLTPEYKTNEAVEVVNDFLPQKSREKYLKTYENFMDWKKTKNAKSFSEAVFCTYFKELATSKQPTTLWTIYSMLKPIVRLKHEVQINSYTKLLSYIRRLSVGHRLKKSRVLTAQNINTFLKDAPDYSFLAMKVALLFGVNGALRVYELLDMSIDHIQKHSDQLLLVTVPNTDTKNRRSFFIREEYVKIVERYQALRPPGMKTNRFFISYRNGKCTRQVVGKNKISAMPGEIASYLKLPNPKQYTGHCFRRTSALLASSGVDLSSILRHGC